MNRKPHKSFQLFLLALLAFFAAATLAHATPYTWNGNAGLWSTTTGWTPNGTPGASDDVTYDSTGIANLTTALGSANQSVKSITFNYSSSAYTVRLYSSTTTTTTARNLVVGTGGITVSAGDHTILGAKGGSGTTGSLQMGSGATSIIPFNIAAGSSLTFDARLRQVSTPTYTKSGTGTLIFNADSGGTSGWSFSGFTVSEGVLRFTSVNAFGTSGNDYSVSSGAALEISGGVSQVVGAGTGTITLNGTGIGSAGALRSVSGNNSFTSSGDIILNADSSIGVDADTLSITPIISGSSKNLTKVGAGNLTLGGVNTYSGSTTISAGTLALGSSGSINNSTAISIAAGATYDVSAIATYNLSSGTTLSASGTGTGAGTQATLKGGTTVSLGSQGLTLTWGGATSGTDSTHPCLVVSQGALTLNNNAFTINGSTLGDGIYTLISVTGGSITGTPNSVPTGTAIDGSKQNVVSVSGGSVILTVSAITGTATTTTVSRSAGSEPSTYGSVLTFKASVVPASGLTVPTGTVQFKTNNVNYGSPVTVVTDSGSNGKAEIIASTLPRNAAAYNITAVYTPADASFLTSSDTTGISQTINQAPVTVATTAASKMYDGTTAATITGTLSGVLPADSGNVTLTGIGTFASAAVGSGISVTGVSCSLVGSAAGNYSLSSPPTSLTANILDTGIWSNPAGGFWHTAANWTEGSDNVVAAGANNTADFNQVSLSADTTVTLSAPVIIGNLIFGNTAASPSANWILNSNGVVANKLILAGTSPTVTVNNLGTSKTATISAVVDGTAGLTKTGPGTLVLDNRANTYTGNTLINQGTLQIGNGVSSTAGTLGANSSTAIASGAALKIERYFLNGTTSSSDPYNYAGTLSGDGSVLVPSIRRFDFSANQTSSGNLSFTVDGLLAIRTGSGVTAVHLGELTGAGSIQRGGTASGAATLFIGGKNTSSIYAGTIGSAELSVEKVGTGKLTLSAANTYSGNTTISAGTLALSGSGSLASVNMAIAPSATFDVTAITPTSYNLPSGTLTVTIDKTSGNKTQGQLVMGGKNLTYGGTLTVTKSGTDALASGDSFPLVTTSGTYGGWFSSVSLPSLGSGLAWDTNHLATAGILDVYPFTATDFAGSMVSNTVITIPSGKWALYASSGKGTPVAVAATCSHGSATVNAGALTYTPTTDYVGSDSITVTLGDGHSVKTLTMAVTVTVNNANVSLQLVPTTVSVAGVDHYQINASGLPNAVYEVQANTDAAGVWIPIATNSAAANGVFTWTDPDPMSTHSSRFYRMAQH